MGFKNGAYAKVWSVETVSDVKTKMRISISRKNKVTNEFIEDFSGFVACVGADTAKQAAALKKGDRIKLGGCDVTNRYDAEKKTTYTNFTVFDFEVLESSGSPAKAERNDPVPANVDDGEPANSRLPF